MKRLIAALVLVTSLAGTASADDQRVTLRGTVTAVDAASLSLTTAAGPLTLPLTPTTRVQLLTKADFSAIKTGAMVGVVAVAGPTGALRARAIQIFPAGATVAVRSGPWDSEPGATMTNAPITTIADAPVDNVTVHLLTLTLPTGDKQVVVSPSTAIVTLAPGDRSAIVPGAHVLIFTVKHDDGTSTVSVVGVGQGGFAPPM